MRLQDRVAIVTGGGSGIGEAIARLFASEGARVAVADLRRERAEGTVETIAHAGGAAIAIQTDVSARDAVEAMARRVLDNWGRVDILVNNAAIAQGDDIRAIDEETWDRNLTIVLKGAFLCSKSVVPAMIEQGRGAIVNIASVNGLTGLGEEAYSAAKAGLINLTQNVAVKYGQYNVRANVICPG